MKRRVLLVLLFLLLGAILNVAVAWACEILLRDSYNTITVEVTAAHRELWHKYVPLSWEKEPGDVAINSRFGSDSILLTEKVGGSGRSSGNVMFRDLAGVPFRSMEGLTLVDRGTRQVTEYGVARIDERWWHPFLKLSLQVRWRATIANSIFYAIFIASLWWLWVYFRRKRCIRRGRCPMCNYDLRGALDVGCSECGWGRP